MEVYIDHTLVKSKYQEMHVHHLSEAFEILKKYNMKLNPTKCHFGVKASKFLGYLITKRGIKAYRDKLKSVLNIVEPMMKKDVQRMTGQLAALTRFIPKASSTIFEAIKKGKDFIWIYECKRSLE